MCLSFSGFEKPSAHQHTQPHLHPHPHQKKKQKNKIENKKKHSSSRVEQYKLKKNNTLNYMHAPL